MDKSILNKGNRENGKIFLDLGMRQWPIVTGPEGEARYALGVWACWRSLVAKLQKTALFPKWWEPWEVWG